MFTCSELPDPLIPEARDRVRRLVTMVMVVGICVVAAGCTLGVDSSPSIPTSTTTVTVVAPSSEPPRSVASRTPTSAVDRSDLTAATTKSLQAMLNRQPGSVGIAVMPVGGDRPASQFGELPTEVAWSTIKVPLALAAFRRLGADAQPDIELAIVNSDNAAAERLWSMLGTPAQAAAAVQGVLVEAGDSTTTVQSQRVRPGFTAFGQTEWSLIEQVRFAAQLPCLPDSAGIVALMNEVGGTQQWGVAMIDEAAVKGGWGPQPDGVNYLVRQLAVIPTASGDVAVTVATTPDAGNFEDGTAILDTVAVWISENLDQLPAGEC